MARPTLLPDARGFRTTPDPKAATTSAAVGLVAAEKVKPGATRTPAAATRRFVTSLSNVTALEAASHPA
jgi:hypothetical protein